MPTFIRTSARPALAGVVAGVLGLTLAPAPSATAAAASTTASAGSGSGSGSGGGNVALTWAPTYMSDNHAYSRTEAVALARSVDLIAGMPIAFEAHTGAMRSANPRLRLLAYANATLAQPRDVASLPERAFAHGRDGHRIWAAGWGTYLMESSNKKWRRAADAQCRSRANGARYDGCLVDMLTLGIYSRNFVTALPVVPGSRQVYTQAGYRKQMASLARSYRRKSPGLVHVGNAVENSYRYWQSPVRSRPLARGMPAAQMEDFLRGAHSSVTDFPSVEDWVRNVSVVRDLEAGGVKGLFTTKVWSAASWAQVAQWQGYAMATFLMGAGGRSYFAFTRSRDKAGASGTNAPYDMPNGLGSPTGAMHRHSSGAFVRGFAGGRSVVNPTGSWVTLALGGTYRTLDGRHVSTLTLAPHSGDVLVAS